jgi:hypothetical protein
LRHSGSLEQSGLDLAYFLTLSSLSARVILHGEVNMENQTCSTLIDNRPCGLALVLVDRDFASETEIYECPLGHRAYVALGESEKRRCPTLTDGKECGLTLIVVAREPETATEICECPLGHRTYRPLEPEPADDEPT